MKNNNLVGFKWGELTDNQKDILMERANVIDAETGNNADFEKDGDYTIDFNEYYSTICKVVDGEIIIADESKIYNPAEGIL